MSTYPRSDKEITGEYPVQVLRRCFTSCSPSVIDAIDEQRRQFLKFGAQNDLDYFKWITIITEELGEAAEALLKLNYNNDSYVDFRSELVHVAACALSAVNSIDYNENKKNDEKG